MYVPPIPQQVFARMTRLTFFLGILIGLLVAVFIMQINATEAKHWGNAFPLDAPLVTQILLPLLSYLLLGTASLLQWRRELLRARYPVLDSLGGKAPASQRASVNLACTLMGFGLAGVDLIGLAFSLDMYHANWPSIVFVVMLCSFAVAWYLHRRNRRRGIQP